jgi:hypothetical protein
MSIVSVLVYILEAMFALGLVGSFVVLVLTTLEDGKTLFENGKGGEPERARTQNSAEHSPLSSGSHKAVTT